MGRIDRIEVTDFKSYRGHQVIGPFQHFTCVIGPNGAGKSNLMDALSFVLGVRASHLRGTQVRDLIYKGDPEHVPSRAVVKLVFVGDDERERHFQRTVLPTGSTEYRFNGSPMTWERYNDELVRINILVKARNFLVFQGDVENIASRDAKELAGVFETISGSEELRKEYERLRTAKEQAEADTIFNYSKKKSMAAEKKQYKEQKEEAEEFQRHLDTQAELQRDYALWQLRETVAEFDKASAALRTTRGELEHASEHLTSIDEALAEKRKEQAVARKELVTAERKKRDKEAERDKERPTVIRLKEQMAYIARKLKEERLSYVKIEEDKEANDKQVAALQKDLRKLRKVKADFDAESQQQESEGVTVPKSQLDEYNKRKEDVARKTLQERQQLDGLFRARAHAKELLERSETQLRELSAARQRVEDELMRYAERVRSLQERAATVEAAKLAAQERLTEAEAESRRVNERKAEVNRVLEQALAQLRQAKSESRQNERAVRMTEAVEELKRLFPNRVFGRLSDVCRPRQKKYNLAVSVALGRFFDALVVDTHRTAEECVQYLREKRVGVMTCLPLDSIKTKKLNEGLRTLSQGVKLAFDVIEFDQSYSSAVLFAVGNTLVCETLEQARRICFARSERHKAVTIDGSVIAKSGNMTGGTSGLEGHAKRWNEREIEGLKRSRDTYTSELLKLTVPREAVIAQEQLRADVQGHDRLLGHIRLDLRVAQEKMKRLEGERAVLDDKLAELGPQADEQREKLDEVAAEVSGVERTIHNIEDKMFADFSRSIGVDNIREYEATKLRTAKERAEREAELNLQLTRVENQLEFQQHRDLDAPMKRLLATITENQAQLSKAEAELAAVEQRLQKLGKDVEKADAVIAELTNKSNDFASELSALKKEHGKHLNAVGALHKKSTSLDAEVEQVRAKRQSIWQTCQMEQIVLPLREGAGGARRRKGAAATAAADADEGSAASTAFDIAQVDFDGLDERLRKLAKNPASITTALFEERLRQVSDALQVMAPNMKAVGRLDDVRERMKSTSDELETARERSREITEGFNRVRKQRTELFMKAFEHVSGVIDSVYKELTRTDDHPGGTAHLTLESNDEPYLHGVKYYAMPPQKRFRDIESLSGGERTVAALALLFGIHTYQPAPFFVLDEVDAALDNVNLAKLVRYVRQRASERFQFVVISLKDVFYGKSDMLVGIHRDRAAHSSATLTLDLRSYAQQS